MKKIISMILLFMLVAIVACAKKRVYVTEESAPNQIVKAYDEIVLPTTPRYISISKNSKILYLIDSDGRDLFVVDAANGQVVQRVSLPFTASLILPDGTGKYVYIASSGSHEQLIHGILKYNLKSGRIEKEIFMDKVFYSVGGAVSPDGKFLYLSDINANYITKISTAEFMISEKIPLENGGGFGLYLSDDGNRLYVIHAFSRSLSIVNTVSGDIILEIRGIGKLPVAVSVNEDRDIAYIMDNTNSAIIAVNIRTREVMSTLLLSDLFYFSKSVHIEEFSPHASLYFSVESKALIAWNPYLPSPAMVDTDDMSENIRFIDIEPTSITFCRKTNLLYLSDKKYPIVRILKIE